VSGPRVLRPRPDAMNSSEIPASPQTGGSPDRAVPRPVRT